MVTPDLSMREGLFHAIKQVLNGWLRYPGLGKIETELGEDVIRPVRKVKSPFCKSEQAVPQMRWIEHARVKNNGESHECCSA